MSPFGSPAGIDVVRWPGEGHSPSPVSESSKWEAEQLGEGSSDFRQQAVVLTELGAVGLLEAEPLLKHTRMLSAVTNAVGGKHYSSSDVGEGRWGATWA